MDIEFKGKYKSLTNFDWPDIPNFVVLTGPNGSGKTQLLELIYNTVINKHGTNERVIIKNKVINSDEVTFIRGEWQLDNISPVNLAMIQGNITDLYQQFSTQYIDTSNEYNRRILGAHNAVLLKTGKQQKQLVTREEFDRYFPELFYEQDSQIGQKIGEIFYNYRISEIEYLAERKSPEEIINLIGQKPWAVLREIIKEAKLPFEINDPTTIRIKDSFVFRLTKQFTNENVNLSDLSSGEKVLISLIFYLYTSREKHVFPKLMLLDEPDAHLHPSMSQQFLNVVKNVLVDTLGVQIIMTTHSPSTVILAPASSIYEMSQQDPRIKVSSSKNHSVSLLTAGLVYVGDGTRYFLVEDKADVDFYTYTYNQLIINNNISANVPLVFVQASTKENSGGKTVVASWINKLQNSGLTGIIQGLIDADSGNPISDGIYKIDRYSIENYLIDPVLVYATLIDKEKAHQVDDIIIGYGEEYKLKSLSNDQLQRIANSIIAMVEPELPNFFTDFDPITDNAQTEIEFNNGSKLIYPAWLINRRGKTLLQTIYNKVFLNTIINYGSLFRSLRKLNMIPLDLTRKFIELKS